MFMDAFCLKLMTTDLYGKMNWLRTETISKLERDKNHPINPYTVVSRNDGTGSCAQMHKTIMHVSHTQRGSKTF